MKERKLFSVGLILIAVFVFWTILILAVDVQPVGVNGTVVGFATLNCLFHNMTGVNMTIYHITDWLGLVPLFCCMIYGAVGFVQLIQRKSLLKVDIDILLLGVYYVIVIFGYLIFEMIPINYRPILIDGIMETSYPSSTTLLVLSVMPTVIFQIDRRIKNRVVRRIITSSAILFSLFMLIGRTIAGVHWLTDIIGSVFLSAGLFLIYYANVLRLDKKREEYRGIQ
ncbi:MAG: phosphatase PAP2 family protein [Ruminococcaceae bacterium]|nr:phosphatase PAP2 family protein [Oscillospiraceae bacterium]